MGTHRLKDVTPTKFSSASEIYPRSFQDALSKLWIFSQDFEEQGYIAPAEMDVNAGHLAPLGPLEKLAHARCVALECRSKMWIHLLRNLNKRARLALTGLGFLFPRFRVSRSRTRIQALGTSWWCSGASPRPTLRPICLSSQSEVHPR